MAAHRKPKARPAAVAAVVTAAIVVPAGTCAASTHGGSSHPRGDHAAVVGSIFAKARSAAWLSEESARHRAEHVRGEVAHLPWTVPSVHHVSVAVKQSTPPRHARPVAKRAAVTTHLDADGDSDGAREAAEHATSPSTTHSTTTGTHAKVTTAQPSSGTAPSTTTATLASTVVPLTHGSAPLSALEPTGLVGAQRLFTPSSTQWANAKIIVEVTQQRGMSLYAAVIATATAIQESSLRNLTRAVDHDSLGLFQQRPSMGWGTRAQVTDPVYATNTFLTALKKYAPHYESQALWVSAQAVQRSGFPKAYAKWEAQAAKMVQAIVTGAR